MGAYGVSILLEGGSSPTPAVKRTFATTLAGAWEELLRPLRAWSGLASDWVSMPFDALLEIEVNENQVMFWFNDSVRWSSALAEHWLTIALAARRRSFELALGKLGLRLPRDWPDLEQARGSGKLFFATDDGRIGRVPDDGEDVAWEVVDYGRSYEAPDTPLEELGATARDAVARARQSRRCGCPLCEKTFPADVIDRFEPVEGFSTRREGLTGAQMIRKIVRTGEHWIIVTRLDGGDAWTFRTSSLGAPGPTIEPLSGRKREVDHIAVFGECVVAQVGLANGARLFSRSRDGGATWSEPEPVIGLPKLKYPQFFEGAAPGVVFATGSPVAEVYRSIDGGASFEAVVTSPALDGKPIRAVAALAEHGGALFALLDMRKRAPVLATSADGGATFRAIAVPGPGQPRSLVVWPGEEPVLGCLTCEYNANTANWRKATFLRSIDAGESWRAHPIGAMGADRVVSVPPGLLVALNLLSAGVFFSSDQGVTWARCASHYPNGIFADPTGERLALLTVYGAIHSVSPHA